MTFGKKFLLHNQWLTFKPKTQSSKLTLCMMGSKTPNLHHFRKKIKTFLKIQDILHGLFLTFDSLIILEYFVAWLTAISKLKQNLCYDPRKTNKIFLKQQEWRPILIKLNARTSCKLPPNLAPATGFCCSLIGKFENAGLSLVEVNQWYK